MSDSYLLLWSTVLLVLVLAGYGLARTDGRWPTRLRAATVRLRGAVLRAKVCALAASAPPNPTRGARSPRARGRAPAAPRTCRHRVHASDRPRPRLDGTRRLRSPGIRPEYFRGVREHLEAKGHRVYASRVSPLAGVRRRAEQLAEQTREHRCRQGQHRRPQHGRSRRALRHQPPGSLGTQSHRSPRSAPRTTAPRWRTRAGSCATCRCCAAR